MPGEFSAWIFWGALGDTSEGIRRRVFHTVDPPHRDIEDTIKIGGDRVEDQICYAHYIGKTSVTWKDPTTNRSHFGSSKCFANRKRALYICENMDIGMNLYSKNLEQKKKYK